MALALQAPVARHLLDEPLTAAPGDDQHQGEVFPQVPDPVAGPLRGVQPGEPPFSAPINGLFVQGLQSVRLPIHDPMKKFGRFTLDRVDRSRGQATPSPCDIITEKSCLQQFFGFFDGNIHGIAC